MFEKIIFYFISTIMILSTIYMIFEKNLFKNLFAMFIVFTSTAVLYFLMNLTLIGIFQLLIYSGAIIVLFIITMNIIISKKENNISARNILYMFFSIVFIIITGSFIYKIFDKNISFEKPNILTEEFVNKLFADYILQLELLSLILTVAVVIPYLILKGDESEI